MKKTVLLVTSLIFLFINDCLFAQGSLTPPGVPGPTMKTLTQIEPRTPISGFFTINASGSYYLTTNITANLVNPVGIGIYASGVTLDLNGFTIASAANYSVGSNFGGIELGSGLNDITIRNGHIRGGVSYNNVTGAYSEFGFGDGINYSGTAPANVHVFDVTVTGCLYYGINVSTGNSTLVESCIVNIVGGYGIEASSVLRSAAYECGNTAISGNIVTDCYGYSTGTTGLSVSETANNCYGGGAKDDGLDAGNANNCFAFSTSGDGMNVGQTANNCYGVSVSGIGLLASTANNCEATSESGTALNATLANNCFCEGQESGSDGLSATTAIGCYGTTPGGNGIGINVTIAVGCYGVCAGVGSGITAHIANSCYSSTGDGDIANKYNMP